MENYIADLTQAKELKNERVIIAAKRRNAQQLLREASWWNYFWRFWRVSVWDERLANAMELENGFKPKMY